MKDFILEILTRLGVQAITPTSEGFEGVCPFHKGSNNKRTFRVAAYGRKNRKPGAYKCHNVGCPANRGGYLETLVAKAFRVSRDEAKDIVAAQSLNAPRRTAAQSTLAVQDDPEELAPMLWPYVGKKCQYLLNRGLQQEDLDHFSIAYNETTDEVIIPTFSERSELVGLTRRPARNGGRYLHSRFPKSAYLWGLHLWDSDIHTSIVICEGQLDPVGLRPRFTDDSLIVAQMGADLSDRQAALVSMKTETAFLAYDNDAAGEMATLKSIRKLRTAGLTDIYVVMYNAPDPCDLALHDSEVTGLQRSSRWIETHLH